MEWLIVVLEGFSFPWGNKRIQFAMGVTGKECSDGFLLAVISAMAV